MIVENPTCIMPQKSLSILYTYTISLIFFFPTAFIFSFIIRMSCSWFQLTFNNLLLFTSLKINLLMWKNPFKIIIQIRRTPIKNQTYS